MTLREWSLAERVGVYAPPSLEAEGFIHFSFPEQVAATANRYYSGVEDLRVLLINPERLGDQLVVEATVGTEAFPHLYRALQIGEVAHIIELFEDDTGFLEPILPLT